MAGNVIHTNTSTATTSQSAGISDSSLWRPSGSNHYKLWLIIKQRRDGVGVVLSFWHPLTLFIPTPLTLIFISVPQFNFILQSHSLFPQRKSFTQFYLPWLSGPVSSYFACMQDWIWKWAQLNHLFTTFPSVFLLRSSDLWPFLLFYVSAAFLLFFIITQHSLRANLILVSDILYSFWLDFPLQPKTSVWWQPITTSLWVHVCAVAVWSLGNKCPL